MAEFHFKVRELTLTKMDIQKKHPKADENTSTLNNEQIRELILKIVSMPETQLRKYVFLLNNDELKVIAGYIPYNYFQSDSLTIPLDNLFYVIEKRLDNKPYLLILLYSEWQKCYDNKECNGCMLKFLKRIEEKYHDQYTWFRYLYKALEAENLLLYLAGEIQKQVFAENSNFKWAYTGLGFEVNNKLYYDLESLYYCLCRKEEYLRCENLLSIVTQYYIYDTVLKSFFANFFEKFSVTELVQTYYSRFQKVLLFIKGRTGEPDSKKWKDFFNYSDISDESIEKFIDWINFKDISDAFGNDERSIFWRKYKFRKIEKMTESQALVMYFRYHFVVEFLGKAKGPLYIYEDTKQIRREVLANSRNLNNNKFRKKLLHSHYFERIIHSGDWEYKTDSFLKEKNIAHKLEER